jgi:hypothetical protein
MSIVLITFTSLFLLIGGIAVYYWVTTKGETTPVEPVIPTPIVEETKIVAEEPKVEPTPEPAPVLSTIVETQITDAVTTDAPKKPKRGRRPTKKKGKTAKK